MPQNRALRGDDIFHMDLASPTGAAVAMEAPVRLSEVSAYVVAQIPAAEPALVAPTLDEIVATVLAQIPTPPVAPVVPTLDEIVAAVLAKMPAAAPVPATETKVYSDGTTATGPGPLPNASPAQQDSTKTASVTPKS